MLMCDGVTIWLYILACMQSLCFAEEKKKWSKRKMNLTTRHHVPDFFIFLFFSIVRARCERAWNLEDENKARGLRDSWGRNQLCQDHLIFRRIISRPTLRSPLFFRTIFTEGAFTSGERSISRPYIYLYSEAENRVGLMGLVFIFKCEWMISTYI